MERSKGEIEEEVLKVITMYFDDEDYQGYLDQLHNKEGIEEELSKIFGYKE